MGCTSSSEVIISKKGLPKVYFISGSPGSGKRTQCKKIVEKYGFKFVSCGNLLRDEAAKGGELGDKIKSLQNEGKLVPSQIVIDMIKAQITNPKEVYLIEGFPKNMENVELWNKQCGHLFNLMPMFYFHCGVDILEERLKDRQAKSGRADDSLDVIKKRIDVYVKETRPVVAHYEKKRQCVHINSERSVEAVFRQICQYVDFYTTKKEIRLPEVIFISGQLASGKRSQAQSIKEKYGYEKIVTNELLHEATKKTDARGKKIADLMNQGQFVPSGIVVDLIIEKIDSCQNRYFVIEGFPKNQENVDVWNRKMVGITHTKIFFFFDVCEKVALRRLEERIEERPSGHNNIEAMKNRMSNFSKFCEPLKKHFEALGKLAYIDCNRPQDSVFRQICLKIDEQMYYKRIILPKVIFVVGGPGAGKGTQCAKMKEAFNFEHYSTGDLLRQQVSEGGEFAAEIKAVQDAGKLVSSDLLVDIVKANIEFKTGTYMLDGFPRSQENIDVWEKKMNGVCELQFLLYFECEQSAMEARMIERSKTSGRSDDNPETIKLRLATFFDQTKPIIDYFKKKGHIVSINADREIDAIFESVREEVHTRIIHKKSDLPNVIFVNGGPGAGKRTLCKQLAAKFGCTHLNVGQLLREASQSSCAQGTAIKRCLDEGILVCSQMTMNVIQKKIMGSGLFLLDGFPKSHDNLDCWNKAMLYKCNFKFLLLLECNEETMIQRQRQAAGEETPVNEALISKRMHIFKTTTLRLMPGYEKHGKVVKINVSSLSADEVLNQASAHIK